MLSFAYVTNSTRIRICIWQIVHADTWIQNSVENVYPTDPPNFHITVRALLLTQHCVYSYMCICIHRLLLAMGGYPVVGRAMLICESLPVRVVNHAMFAY